MKCSIFDKEKNDLVREEDESVIIFDNQDEAVGCLQDEGLKDEWIKSNFVFLKRTQPLIPDVLAFRESQIIDYFKCKNCGEEFNNELELRDHACTTKSSSSLPEWEAKGLPDFLYKKNGEIFIGYDGDSLVTDEWKKYLSSQPSSINPSTEGVKDKEISELKEMLRQIDKALYIGKDLDDVEILKWYIDVCSTIKEDIQELLSQQKEP